MKKWIVFVVLILVTFWASPKIVAILSFEKPGNYFLAGVIFGAALWLTSEIILKVFKE